MALQVVQMLWSLLVLLHEQPECFDGLQDVVQLVQRLESVLVPREGLQVVQIPVSLHEQPE